MPRRRPPHILRCTCGYETARVRGRPPKECPKCGGALTAFRVVRPVKAAT